MKKYIQNIDIVAHKLELPLIRATNLELKVIREKMWKKKKIVKKRKVEAIAAKCQRNRGGIILFSKKKRLITMTL